MSSQRLIREHCIMRQVMLEAAAVEGITLFRNNVGVAQFPDGARVKYGLIKGSSDLIGWKSRTIVEADVGKKVAVFLAVEVKMPKALATEDQVQFLARVRECGGIGILTHGPEEFRAFLANVQ